MNPVASATSSQSGGLFSGILELIKFFGNFGNVIAGIMQSLVNYASVLIYYIVYAICNIVRLAEMLFKALAGINTDYTNANSGQFNDLISQMIMTPQIYNLFISILVLSIFLLFIFTFIAIIKSEFAADVKGSAKGPIIGRAFKSLAMFIIVPAVSYMGIIAFNVLTQTVNNMMQGGESNLANQVFYVMMFKANNARNNEKFARYINGQEVNGVTPPWAGGDTGYINNNSGVFHTDKTETADIMSEVSAKIDDAFRGNQTIANSKAEWKLIPWLTRAYTGIEQGNLIIMPLPISKQYTPWDVFMVSYYYSLGEMDYMLGIVSAVAITFILLGICWSLVKRMFDIVILLLLAAPMISLAPLDNGSASKKWQGEFIKRVVAIIGPVFAINMYFIIIPVVMTINIFATGAIGVGSIAASSMASSMSGAGAALVLTGVAAGAMATWNAITTIFFMIVGLQVVKQSGALLSNLLGIEDLTKAGMDGVKKAAGTAIKLGMAAATGGAAAVGMAAAGAAADGAAGNQATTSMLGERPTDPAKAADYDKAAADLKAGKGASYGGKTITNDAFISQKKEELKTGEAKDHADKEKDLKKQRNKAFGSMATTAMGAIGLGDIAGAVKEGKDNLKEVKDTKKDGPKSKRDALKAAEEKEWAEKKLKEKQAKAEESIALQAEMGSHGSEIAQDLADAGTPLHAAPGKKGKAARAGALGAQAGAVGATAAAGLGVGGAGALKGVERITIGSLSGGLRALTAPLAGLGHLLGKIPHMGGLEAVLKAPDRGVKAAKNFMHGAADNLQGAAQGGLDKATGFYKKASDNRTHAQGKLTDAETTANESAIKGQAGKRIDNAARGKAASDTQAKLDKLTKMSEAEVVRDVSKARVESEMKNFQQVADAIANAMKRAGKSDAEIKSMTDALKAAVKAGNTQLIAEQKKQLQLDKTGKDAMDGFAGMADAVKELKAASEALAKLKA